VHHGPDNFEHFRFEQVGGGRLVSRMDEEPHLTFTSDQELPEEFFRLEYESMAIKDVRYDREEANISSETVVLGHGTAMQSTIFMEYEVSNTNSYECTWGVSIPAGARFPCTNSDPSVQVRRISLMSPVDSPSPIQLVVESKFGPGSSTYTWDEPNSYPQNRKLELEAVSPHWRSVVDVTAEQFTVSIPYKMILASLTTGVETVSEGIWHGVHTRGTRIIITKKRLEDIVEYIPTD
jgi:hypothetical protein